MSRTFAREGLGYVLRVPDIATEIAVSRMSSRSGDTYGEVLVMCGIPGTRSLDGILHQARLNLTSTSARTTLAKVLTQRSAAPEIDWQDLLEEFCRRVLNAEREGDPIQYAGDRPQRLTPAWQVDPILASLKPTILYGEGGTGKSTIATAIAVSVETGVTIIPGWIPRKARVLYLDWEAEVDDLDDRVKAIARGANIPYPVQIAHRRMWRPLADQAEDIARQVTELGAGVVVIDSIAPAAGTSGEGSDASENAIRLFAAFRLLGATVLALAHVSKADQADPGKPARPYGSVFYTNLARATFEIRRSPGSGDVSRLGIYNTKSNVTRLLPPVGLEVRQSDDIITYERFDLVDDPALSKRLSVWDRARALLGSGDWDDGQLAEALEVSEGVLRATLSRAAKAQLVERLPSSKKWRLIPRAG